MLPSAAYEISGFAVENGDSICAWINYVGDGVFQMTIEKIKKFTSPFLVLIQQILWHKVALLNG
jgi:hypothetical protein